MSFPTKVQRSRETPPETPSERVGSSETEELTRISQVVAAHPEDSGARRHMYKALRRWLDRDAFLAYVSESKTFYQVRTRSGLDLNVPKDRAATSVFPSPEPSLLHSASKWLAASILGLFLGGALTVLVGPVIIVQASVAWVSEHPSGAEKVRALTFILCALSLMLVGTVLSALLIVHIIY